jgi:ABC-type branched-subunit amino acid transport system ATPase component
MSSPLLEASGIAQRFGALVVLDGVDFQLATGESVGIVC